jgi:SAM-dependent methyltransferase
MTGPSIANDASHPEGPVLSFYRQFAEAYERIFPFREGTHAFLREHLPPPPARVLDAGCGTGRYCGRLAAEGFAAVGVDLDEAMIATARRDHPAADFAAGDLGDAAALPADLDGAFCIGNVISHLPAARRRRLAGDLRARMRPGGVWILQTVNWDRILGRGRQDFPPLAADDDGRTVFEREYRDLSRASVRFVTRLRAGGRILFEGETMLHPMILEDVVAAHREAGWRLRRACGDFGGRPHDAETSPATILVFERG